ncbi:MAG: DUF6134 family protein [Alphaproteobacteria bacterium]|nr:DUF6134 family protein [Alphaproteobacteria bacterium]
MYQNRRTVLLGAMGFALTAPLSRFAQANINPRSNDLDFNVFRNGSAIGHHKIDIQHNGNRTTANINILLEVGIGPVVLYRYRHQNTEIWEDGAFKSFSSTTDDDGTPYKITAIRESGSIRVSRDHDSDYVIDDLDILPTTYWHEQTVRCNRLLDTQKGRVMNVTIASQGWQKVPTASGSVDAQCFNIEGDIDFKVWYDRNDRWTKLSFPFKGDDFDYRLV